MTNSLVCMCGSVNDKQAREARRVGAGGTGRARAGGHRGKMGGTRATEGRKE